MLHIEVRKKIVEARENGLKIAEIKQYLRESLLPTLKSGDIVIADNLRAHKGDGSDELIASVGASIVYLPPHSLDFNPSVPISPTAKINTIKKSHHDFSRTDWLAPVRSAS